MGEAAPLLAGPNGSAATTRTEGPRNIRTSASPLSTSDDEDGNVHRKEARGDQSPAGLLSKRGERENAMASSSPPFMPSHAPPRQQQRLTTATTATTTTTTNNNNNTAASSTAAAPSPSSATQPCDPSEYVRRFKIRADECIVHAYESSHRHHHHPHHEGGNTRRRPTNAVPARVCSDTATSRVNANGALFTSLSEDMVFLVTTLVTNLASFLLRQPLNASPSNNDGTTTKGSSNSPLMGVVELEPAVRMLFEDTVLHLIRCLSKSHQQHRPLWIATATLESSCESANDCLRLSEQMDRLLSRYTATAPGGDDDDNEDDADRIAAHNDKDEEREDKDDSEDKVRLLISQCEPVRLAWTRYSDFLAREAVISAERVHVHVLRVVVGRTRIPALLFSRQWEVELTSNQVVSELLYDVCDSFWGSIRRYLDRDVLRHKALVAVCKAVVCLYVRCLVEKAQDSAGRRAHPHRRNRLREIAGHLRGSGAGPNGAGSGGFAHSGRALRRLKDDIAIIKEYFASKSGGNPTLARILANEVYVLELIYECLEAAAASNSDGNNRKNEEAGNDDDDDAFLQSFVLVLHKRTGADLLVTKHFASDLFFLVNPRQALRTFQEGGGGLQQDLHLVSKRMEEEEAKRHGAGGGTNGKPQNGIPNKPDLTLVDLDQMLRAYYEDRIVQGMLPICWTCLPKVEAEDGGMEVVGAKIRALTRGVADLRASATAVVATGGTTVRSKGR